MAEKRVFSIFAALKNGQEFDKLRILKHLFPYILLLILFCSSCAKVVTPVGGPRDNTPPVVLKELPANQSVNFQANKIFITFDEFFTLNNPTENVLVSPPFKHPAEYITKGKTLVIKIKDTLRKNTTYNMVFSDCIKDFNEGNPIGIYHYSFSTGSVIDSCILDGSVSDAKTLSPSDAFFVMLYRNNVDSLPLTTLPDYLTKTTKDGRFSFRNIAGGDYKIFALKDINSNYLYDLPNEAIAFSDQTVSAYVAPRKDSTGHFIGTDTLRPEVWLSSFEVTDSIPKLMRYENPEAGVYRFPYSKAVTTFEAVPMGEGRDYFQTWSATRDTVIWYMKSLAFDSLRYLLTADGHTDTVLLKPFKPKGAASSGRGSANKKVVSRLRTTFHNEGNCFKTLTLHFSYPILPTDSFDIVLTSKTDTTLVRLAVPDTFVMDLPIPLTLETKKSYQLIIPDSIFTGYNQLTHDTLRSSFNYKSEKDYGNIIINYLLDSVDYPVIVQLMKGQSVVQEDILTTNRTLRYAHLEPGTFSINIIHDRNGNGLWDSGDYRRKIQPERTEKFEKEITVRAFWDIEEDVTVSHKTN